MVYRTLCFITHKDILHRVANFEVIHTMRFVIWRILTVMSDCGITALV